MRRFLKIAALALTAFWAVPSPAEDAGPLETELAKPYRAQAEEVMKRGREMYLYDQAAWHATDRMLADFDNKPDERLRGYVILPGETGATLSAVFFGEIDGKHVEFARYEVEVGKVVSSKVFAEGERPALSPMAERLVAARDTAIDELVAKKYGFCNNERPNYVLLPPGDDGVMSAYFLTPQTDNDSYPLGGHFRVDIGADGKVVSSRRFMNSCFEVNLKATKDKDGEPMTPAGFFVTHLLDPQPTEIHVFASYYLPIEIMVGTTANNLVWGIAKGRIADVESLDKEAAGKD